MRTQKYGQRALDAEEARVRRSEVGERNDTLYRAAYNLGQLVGGGVLDDCYVEEVLLDAAVANGLTGEEATATIRSGLVRGEAHPRGVRAAISTREDAVAELARIAAAADRAKWSGHQGKRMVKVLFGCLSVAHEHGGPSEVALGTTRVCLAASMNNRGRVQRALGELREEGWLTLVQPGAPTRSARYTLRVPRHLDKPEGRSRSQRHALEANELPTPGQDVSRSQAVNTHTPPVSVWPDYATPLEGALARPDHDAFRYGALDTMGWRILRYLVTHAGWHTQVKVAEALGVSRSTVWRWVQPKRSLYRLCVIERSPRGSVRFAQGLGVADLERVARAMNTFGRGEAHRAAVRSIFTEQGWLTDDCHWLDTRTGELGSQARWLLPRTAAGAEPAA